MKDFEKLYYLHKEELYRYLFGLTHVLEQAGDLMQETFLQAMLGIGRFLPGEQCQNLAIRYRAEPMAEGNEKAPGKRWNTMTCWKPMPGRRWRRLLQTERRCTALKG